MKTFKRIYIEITNVCNKNCNFCAKNNRSAKIMNVQEFSDIISKIKMHTKQLYFHVMGEPLLNPNIDTFLDICHKENLKVNLNTNGSLLLINKDKLINKPSLRKLVVSLHSFGANDSKDLEDYLNSIFSVVDELKSNVIIELRMWDIRNKELSNKFDYEIVDIISKHFGKILEINLNNSTEYVLDKNVYLNFGNLFTWPSQNKNVYETGFCYALRTQVAILVDGEVVPCCLDSNGEINLGNIFENTLQDIVSSKRAVDIYNNFTNHKKCEQLCLHCNYLDNKNK